VAHVVGIPGGQPGGLISLDLTANGIALPAGTYYLGIMSQMDFAVGGQNGWQSIPTVTGTMARFFNPGGGFGVGTTATDITTISSGVPLDLSFRISAAAVGNGACCLTNGTCIANITSPACASQGGTWAGANVTCAQANCQPTGACCTNGACTNNRTSAQCTSGGGVWQGASTTCANITCPTPYVINCSQSNFNFTDIHLTGTPLGTGDDSAYLFTSAVTNALVNTASLYAGTNGMINAAPFTTFTNTTIPVAGVTLGLWANWDDLYVDPAQLGQIYTQTVSEGGTNNCQVVQWYNTRTYFSGAGSATGGFEVKIFSAGTGPGGALVQYIYPDMAWDWNGNSSTIGVQWSTTSALAVPGINGNSTNSAGGPLANNTVCSITAAATGPTCYANCDGSTAVPFLNVGDFSCFLTKYAAGNAYANCDGSTSNPVLNVGDFSCFLTKYATGCSAP
jgi:hypothetical protein